ncbi:MAG: M28 family peptidase [Syntrophales bacterium]
MTVVLLLILIFGGCLAYSLLKVRTAQSVSHQHSEAVRLSPLYRHVEKLSVHIGPRSIYDYYQLAAAKDYISRELRIMGHDPLLQDFTNQERVFTNIIVTIPGIAHPEETVLVGAHYDTVAETPGADDNASAVATLLEICRLLKDYRPQRTVKLVFFTLEEPPAFRTPAMGSAVYARRARAEGEKIAAMISLEMLGYYHDREDAQAYPVPIMRLFYPSRPNFIGVVGNIASRGLVKNAAASLKRHTWVPVETLVSVSALPGVDFSDHKPFWNEGYPAIMITDTAFYRNPNYHTPSDTIDTIDFKRLSALLTGLAGMIGDLAG